MQAGLPDKVNVQFIDPLNEKRTDWQERGANFCLYFLRAGGGKECQIPANGAKRLELAQKTDNLALQALAGLMAYTLWLPLTLIGLVLLYASDSYSAAYAKAQAVLQPAKGGAGTSGTSADPVPVRRGPVIPLYGQPAPQPPVRVPAAPAPIGLSPGLQISADSPEALLKEEVSHLAALLKNGDHQMALVRIYQERRFPGKDLANALLEAVDAPTALKLMELVTERHLNARTSAERLEQDLGGDLAAIDKEADELVAMITRQDENTYARLFNSMFQYGRTLGEALMNKMGVAKAQLHLKSTGEVELLIAEMKLKDAQNKLRRVESQYAALQQVQPEMAPMIKMGAEGAVTTAEKAVENVKQFMQIVSQCRPNQDLSTESIGSDLIRAFHVKYTLKTVNDDPNQHGPFFSNILAVVWKNKDNSDKPPSVDEMVGIATSTMTHEGIFNRVSTPEKTGFYRIFADQFNRRFITVDDQKMLKKIFARMITNYTCDFLSTLQVADAAQNAAIAENAPKLSEALIQKARSTASPELVPTLADLVAE